MYTRDSSNTQELGRFDKLAVYGSQRWGINYVTMGERFTNMNNISNRFYVIEMEDLNEQQIRAQVSSVIGNTTI